MSESQSLIHIPIIDISGYLAGDAEATKRIALEFREACEKQGFLQVTGHGVPKDVQADFLEAISQFFALPLKEKEKISQSNSKCYRGYERIGGQKLDELDDSASPDQKEGFSVRPERPLGRFLQGPNQWPESLPNFKATYMRYFDSVHQLSQSIFRLVALSLELPETYFDDFSSDPDGMKTASICPQCSIANIALGLCLCRAHHYPPTPVDVAGQTRGVGAHTDFGAITLLLQDDGRLRCSSLLISTNIRYSRWLGSSP